MKKRNMFKGAMVMALVAGMAAGMAMTSFAATGQWKKNDTGWWWERLGGGYPTNAWVWIDGNNDGVAECYYFDSVGYMLTNTTTPDGYTVNADGAWTQNGVVQTQGTNSDLHDVALAGNTNTVSATGAVMDGNSWAKITFDETLLRARDINGLSVLANLTPAEPGYPGQDYYGPTYSMPSKGKTITLSISTNYNQALGYFGPVSAFFDNFPEQGMELNAFYDNTGYESLAWRRQPAATTGRIFGLPQGSYRMGCGSVAYGTNREQVSFRILLTAGDNGKWYIYPDSPMQAN
ncbi:hypothetical protein D7X87_24800 [bacterium D16-54]|nr:hypothetical protein D7X87_24800 [bacterium D16-54]RKJ09795.1 hypothetical protein D7X65_24655 [bacterium D16-56]